MMAANADNLRFRMALSAPTVNKILKVAVAKCGWCTNDCSLEGKNLLAWKSADATADDADRRRWDTIRTTAGDFGLGDNSRPFLFNLIEGPS